MKVTLAIIMANACFFMSTCTTPPNLLDLVRQTGVLNVVTRNSSTTYYLGSEGPRGFEYDLALGFADFLGVELNIYSAEHLSDIWQDLDLWRADVAAAGLTVTPLRERAVRFTEPYREVHQQLVYRLGRRRPRTPADLPGRKLVVTAGSSYIASLTRLARENAGLSWQEAASADVEELLVRVIAGDIDYTVIDSNEFIISSQYYPELRVAFDISTSDNLAWALRDSADDSLYQAAREYLASVYANGELARIDARYYDNTHRLDYVGTRQFLRHIESRLPRYREQFENVAKQTGFDWQLLAAVGYQESHWNPKAVSPTGVRGLMMLTQATARQQGIADRTDPLQSIDGGGRYLARVRNKIPARIEEPDRTWLALASYNVGYGHLEDARVLTQMHGGDADDWKQVREYLPLLAQKKWHSHPKVRRGYARGWEPVRYVENIRSYYDILIWATSDQYRAQEKTRRVPLQEGGETANPNAL